MSTIGSLSGLSSLAFVSSNSNRIKPPGGGADNEGSRNAGPVGQGANLRQAIVQSLAQTLGLGAVSPTSTAPATTAQDTNTPSSANPNAAAAVQAFMHSLFAALHQAAGNPSTATTPTTTTQGYDRNATGSGDQGRGANISAKIQNLIQQLSANSQSISTTAQTASGSSAETLTNLNSSFQNLVNVLQSSQGSSAPNSSTTSLQAFLQKLAQNLSNGQTTTGAVVNTQA